jgi:hypothetical protein
MKTTPEANQRMFLPEPLTDELIRRIDLQPGPIIG